MNQSNPKQERTPWEVCKNDEAFVTDADGAPVPLLSTRILKRVVHCVNTYDEVVGALEDLIYHIEALRGADAHRVGCQCGGTNDGKYSCASFLISNERARAALAKAKGE